MVQRPVPQPDHTLRAVKVCAGDPGCDRKLTCRTAKGSSSRFGAGIHYGEAVLGGSAPKSVSNTLRISDSVNTAKRMQENSAKESDLDQQGSL